ncbi:MULTISPECIES: TIGR04255 family protein [unclassified Mesorhizobium]|uniref:TIGR04255 family protein n=1 Tax=unclassified Mesorhizobium TaxID=325217 RepID=UPI00167D2A4B|nr:MULTISPECIES: TIGR04255 family protein [unclassified Mesorhizobium]
MKSYSRPPIVEAAVEFVANVAISYEDLQAISNKVAGDYKHQTIDKNIEVRIDTLGGIPTVHSEPSPDRFRRTSDDQADIAMFGHNSMIVARLAPYLGWEYLSERVARNWRIWSKGPTGKNITRVGMRFINRIDIPTAGLEHFDIRDYLKLQPLVPRIAEKPMSGYLVQASMPTANPNWDCNIASTTVLDPPLINHTSILLDIDVYRTRDIPSKAAEILPILEEARALKNTIFELCITDKARELFQ